MNHKLVRKIITLIELKLTVDLKAGNYIAPAHEILPHLIHSLCLSENNGKKPEAFEFMKIKDAVIENINNKNELGAFYSIAIINHAFYEVAEIFYSDTTNLNTNAFRLEHLQAYLVAAISIDNVKTHCLLKDVDLIDHNDICFFDDLKASILLAKNDILKEVVQSIHDDLLTQFKSRQQGLILPISDELSDQQ